jgi:DNA-binding Lrp family transcriptional regulator
MKIDLLDKKIINCLLSDSRLSYRKIAQKTGVSVATVMHHVKRLEECKVIKKYTTLVNYELLGYDIEIILEITISKGKLFMVEKKIASNPNVYAVYDTTGMSDAIIIARFANRRNMDNFIKKIQTYDFVERTHTKLILNTIKEEQMKI